MRDFHKYYLAVYGDLTDRWNLLREFEEEINILSKNDEDLKHELLVSVMVSFNYVINKVFIYLDLKKIEKIWFFCQDFGFLNVVYK